LGNQNIILIAGGADKDLDVTELAQAITQHCKRVFLTPGTGTNHLINILKDTSIYGSEKVIVVENLEQAVTEAKLAAENADIILFSPAFASFAQYQNEYERNDAFMSFVEVL
jgi:UDP-N-acetylmuramoylalanine-D-glutamate ligase